MGCSGRYTGCICAGRGSPYLNQLGDCPHRTGQCLSLPLMLLCTCQALSRNTVPERARPTVRREEVSHVCPSAHSRHTLAQVFTPGRFPGFLNPHSSKPHFRPGCLNTLAAGAHLDVDEISRALQLRGRGGAAVAPRPHDAPGIFVFLSLFSKIHPSLTGESRTEDNVRHTAI